MHRVAVAVCTVYLAAGAFVGVLVLLRVIHGGP